MTESDLAAGKRLCSRVFPEATSQFDFLRECACRGKEKARNPAFVAKAGRQLVGIICCRIIEDKGVLSQSDEPIACMDLVAVDPRFRRRGIASKLWRRMEAKLTTMDVPFAWAARSRVLGSGVDIIKYPEAVVFFLNMGFGKGQDIYDMEARLDELDYDTSRAEATLQEEGIEIKRTEYRECGALRRFLLRRFPPWDREVEEISLAGPQSIYVAQMKRSVIGFAASNGKVFGPIGVEPRYRSKGIGKILMLRCLLDIRERGYETAFIGWANVGFYARAINARITRVMWQMEKKLMGPKKQSP